jgi:hypothetical protein
VRPGRGFGGVDVRCKSWATFLRGQAEAILACDFIETVTLSGQRQYILAVIEHEWRGERPPQVLKHGQQRGRQRRIRKHRRSPQRGGINTADASLAFQAISLQTLQTA